MTIRKLLTSTSVYSMGSAATILAGFISFPILARLLSVEDYGTLSLIASTTVLLAGIGKLGMQHATVRFIRDADPAKSPEGVRRLAVTASLSMLASGAASTLLWLTVVAICSWYAVGWFSHSSVAVLFMLAAPLVFLRVFESSATNILRAQERALLLNGYLVIKKYVVLAVVLGAVLLANSERLRVYFLASALIETAAVMTIYLWLAREWAPFKGQWSTDLAKRLLVFGLPMIGSEVGGLLLTSGDRYFIQAILGSKAVGLYSAAYNLCDYVHTIIVYSVAQAIQPIYLRLWSEQGRAATEEFLNRAFWWYTLAAVGVGTLVIAVGTDLTIVLASRKYVEGAAIIPAVMTGLLIGGTASIGAAGLFVEKRSLLLVSLVLAAVAVNAVLNLLLLPRIGIMGAAVATLMSYVFLTWLMFVCGRSSITVKVPWWAMLKFGLCGGATLVVVQFIDFDTDVIRLVVKGVVGVSLFSALALVCDRSLRTMVLRFAKRA